MYGRFVVGGDGESEESNMMFCHDEREYIDVGRRNTQQLCSKQSHRMLYTGRVEEKGCDVVTGNGG